MAVAIMEEVIITVITTVTAGEAGMAVDIILVEDVATVTEEAMSTEVAMRTEEVTRTEVMRIGEAMRTVEEVTLQQCEVGVLVKGGHSG